MPIIKLPQLVTHVITEMRVAGVPAKHAKVVADILNRVPASEIACAPVRIPGSYRVAPTEAQYLALSVHQYISLPASARPSTLANSVSRMNGLYAPRRWGMRTLKHEYRIVRLADIGEEELAKMPPTLASSAAAIRSAEADALIVRLDAEEAAEIEASMKRG